MDAEKEATFHRIILSYKQRLMKRTYVNELYRSQKIYNFCIEFSELLDALWFILESLFYNFVYPVRNLNLSLGKQVPLFFHKFRFA